MQVVVGTLARADSTVTCCVPSFLSWERQTMDGVRLGMIVAHLRAGRWDIERLALTSQNRLVLSLVLIL